jgi:hypothetical protein
MFAGHYSALKMLQQQQQQQQQHQPAHLMTVTVSLAKVL